MVDEALGTEENKGMMSEIMDELSETTEEMTEQMTAKTVENMEELPDEVLQEQLATDSLEAAEMAVSYTHLDVYKRQRYGLLQLMIIMTAITMMVPPVV